MFAGCQPCNLLITQGWSGVAYPRSEEKFGLWAFAAAIASGLSRIAAAIERDAQQFCGVLIRSRGTGESEAPSSELEEPAAAATCNGSQCLAVAGRPSRWHVSCESCFTLWAMHSRTCMILMTLWIMSSLMNPASPGNIFCTLLGSFLADDLLLTLDRWAVGCMFLCH